MQHTNKILRPLLLLVSVLYVFPHAAQSQTYVEVYPGSKYVCGLMPDGTNLIFINGGSNANPITLKKATSSVKRDISKIQGRIERLNEIKSSLKDGVLSKSEVKGFTNIMKSADPDLGPLPKGKAERRDAINALIARLKIDIRNRKAELKSLQDCDNDRRPEQPADNVETEFLKFKAADGIYIALIMYVPVVLNSEGKPYPQRWYCVQSSLDQQGAPRLFTGNPCRQGVPAFPGNSCPQFSRKGYLSEFFAFRIFQGSFFEIDDPIVLNAEGEFKTKYAGGVAGRPRTSLADNCAFVD